MIKIKIFPEDGSSTITDIRLKENSKIELNEYGLIYHDDGLRKLITYEKLESVEYSYKPTKDDIVAAKKRNFMNSDARKTSGITTTQAIS